MEISLGIKVLLAVSTGEALNCRLRRWISNTLPGLLKLEDFRDERLFFEMTEDEWKQVLAEMDSLAAIWQETHVSCKQARRRLRGILLKENSEKGEFTGHRTNRCRVMFDEAEKRQQEKEKDFYRPSGHSGSLYTSREPNSGSIVF